MVGSKVVAARLALAMWVHPIELGQLASAMVALPIAGHFQSTKVSHKVKYSLRAIVSSLLHETSVAGPLQHMYTYRWFQFPCPPFSFSPVFARPWNAGAFLSFPKNAEWFAEKVHFGNRRSRLVPNRLDLNVQVELGR